VADDDLACDQTFSMSSVLSSCTHIENEITALEALVNSTEHAVILSPNGDCKCAGEGVEYCFGMCKRFFRGHYLLSGANLQGRVLASVGAAVVTLTLIRTDV